MEPTTTSPTTTMPIPRSVGRSTEETSSDAPSVLSSDGHYQIIEYDYPYESLNIQDDSPAAEALRANATIKVSKSAKAARAVHMQSVRRVLKRATGKPKTGNRKGKPPRVPPHSCNFESDDEQSVVYDPNAHLDGVTPGTAEAGKKVMGNIDPHDLLKLVRWRRKSTKSQKKKSYVKGKVIDGEHELYTLSIAVMIGVRQSIIQTNEELNRDTHQFVTFREFRAAEKYEFRPKGDGPLPPHQLAHTFKFKDYSPVPFAYLRRMYGVNEFDFLLSVCGNANFIEFISNAKSGQFFFYSSDGRYMIKTMTNAESKFLRRILPAYFKHCAQHPNTLLTRFFGMYRVKLYHLRRNVKFVIMNSVYYTDKHLHTFYDLKGSSVGRDAKPGQAVRKDNDLRQLLPDGALAMHPDQQVNIKRQLEADVKFLESVGIMDYSMLVGVHHVPAFEVESKRTLSFRQSSPAKGLTPNTATTPMARGGGGDTASLSSPPRGNRSPLRSVRKLSQRFEDGLEEDDNSYLVGSDKRPEPADRSKQNLDTERKKQATVEKLFWPFHHMFDIHGHRRLAPVECAQEEEKPTLTRSYQIPKFVPPLSDRKDGGFEMDVTGLSLPMKLTSSTNQDSAANTRELLYEGKIFYMGIIDILQEYNSRKAVESRYRYLRSSVVGALGGPSCVPPREYGKRFLDFFDEYTKRDSKAKTEHVKEQGTEVGYFSSERTS